MSEAAGNAKKKPQRPSRLASVSPPASAEAATRR